jgi:GWxTD domain-containing protein
MEVSKVADSASAMFSFSITEKNESKVLPVILPTRSRSKSTLHVFLTDGNKGVQEDFFINLDRASHPSRQDFLLLNSKNEPLFRNYVFDSDSLRIQYRESGMNKFVCKYYHREFELSPPPYSFDIRHEFDYRPDSTFIIDVSHSNLIFNKEGFYHIQKDTSGRDGLTLFHFNNGFPDIINSRQMIEAARYLITRKEYEEMKSASSPKTMIDNFWLSHGGNEERTRNLIKKYYGRVRDANKYFTSYTEGWRTDRGMIFIIFGMPTAIYKSPESESWTYGTPNSTLALNFFFVKVNNPFTENDYSLSRSPNYESNWYRAVETWRQGRAYNSYY